MKLPARAVTAKVWCCCSTAADRPATPGATPEPASPPTAEPPSPSTPADTATGSGAPDGNYGIDALVAELTSVIDALDEKPVPDSSAAGSAD
jgi:hypothetical protein